MEQNKTAVISVSGEPARLVKDRLFTNTPIENLSSAQRTAEIRYRKRLSKHRASAYKKFHYSPDSPVEWSNTIAQAVQFDVADKKISRIFHAVVSVLIVVLAAAIFLFGYTLASFGFLQALALETDEMELPEKVLVALSTSAMSVFIPWLVARSLVRIFTHFFRLDLSKYKNGRYYAVKMQETIRHFHPLTGKMEAIHHTIKNFVTPFFWSVFAVFVVSRLGYFLQWNDFFDDIHGPAFTANWLGFFSELLRIEPLLNAAQKLGYASLSVQSLFANPFLDSLLLAILLDFIQIAFRCINYGRACKCCKTVNCFRKETTETITRRHLYRSVSGGSSYSGTVDGHSVTIKTSSSSTNEPYTSIYTTIKTKYLCDVCNTCNGKEFKTESTKKDGHVGKEKETKTYVER